MKRSAINQAVRSANSFFKQNGWALPPAPRWDVTDFGLGEFDRYGLVLVNLADEPEYCEKLMYARKNQETPAHCHAVKKEDIIARAGSLAVQVWHGKPGGGTPGTSFLLKINGQPTAVSHGGTLTLNPGDRVTLEPGIYHAFFPLTSECIIGEVSTANNDVSDNFFLNPDIGRYPDIEEDESPLVALISDKT